MIGAKTVTVDGVTLNEPYISQPANPSGQKWVVPQNDYFVLGDNRPVSDDSRYLGIMCQKMILVGKAVIVYWPLKSGY